MRRENHLALVAELVDALVSNTNGVTSLPVRSRPGVQKVEAQKILRLYFYFYFFLYYCKINIHPFNHTNNQTIIEILATKLAFVITLLTAVIPIEVWAQQYKVVITYGTEFCDGSYPTDPSKPNEGYFDNGATVFFRVSDRGLQNALFNDNEAYFDFSPASDYYFDVDLQYYVYKYTVENSDCIIDSYYPVAFNDDKPQE